MSVALQTTISVESLLEAVGIESRVYGQMGSVVDSVCSLSDVTPGSLCFCNTLSDKIVNELCETSSAVIIANRYDERLQKHSVIVTHNPFLLFAHILIKLFGPRPDIAMTANKSYGPAMIAQTAIIHEGATVMAGCEVGDGCILMPGVVLYSGVKLGRNVVVESNTVIGTRGIAVVETPQGKWLEVPHVGNVIIEDDVSIGANSVVMRALIDRTYIGKGTKIANLVNIGHNCHVGSHCWISSGVQLAGSTRVENGAMIGMAAMTKNRISIGEKSQVGLGAVVVKNVGPAVSVFGNPAKTLKTMKRWRSD